VALFYFLFQWPFVGMGTRPLDQTSAVYDALAGDGLSTWIGCFRLALSILALAISIFFFWRFITAKDLDVISN